MRPDVVCCVLQRYGASAAKQQWIVHILGRSTCGNAMPYSGLRSGMEKFWAAGGSCIVAAGRMFCGFWECGMQASV
jgi:hypothetical protein